MNVRLWLRVARGLGGGNAVTLFGDVVCSDARLGIWGPGIGDITIRYQG